jgi:hypothetical protein
MKKQMVSRIIYALMIVLLAMALLPARPAAAAAVACTFTSNVVGSGNWSASGSWTPSGAGPGNTCASTYPGQSIAGDVVVMSSGDTINVDVSPANSVTSVTFPSNNTSNSTLSLNSGITLNISGAITLPRAGSSGGTDYHNTLAAGAGTLNAGSIAFTNGGGTERHRLTISTGTVTVSGNVTCAGGGGGCSGSATITFTGAGTLKLGGTIFTSTQGTMTTFTGSTVEYTGAAQTVGGFAYDNLAFSGTGVKDIPNTTTVSGTLWIKGPGGSGQAQAHLTTGDTLNVANLWLGDDGVSGVGNWGGTGCAGSSCNVRTAYFTASTGYVHVTSGATLPVTMNYFHAKYQNGSLSIDWSTGTETGNVGFNLYVWDAKGKHKLNAQLIPSTGFTTHTPQDYHFAASGLSFSGTITFYLEDIDFLGKTMLHGPFSVGQVYGQRVVGTPTNWQQIQAACSQHAVLGKHCAGY